MNQFAEFLKKRRYLVICVFLTSLFTYITYWINSEDILTDMETFIMNPAGMSETYKRVGRLGLVFTKKLFFTGFQVPALSLGYMIITMALAALLLDYAVWRLGGKSGEKLEWFYLPFSCLFVSSPVLAHQFYFYYQAFEVSFSFLLGILASYWVTSGYVEKKAGFILMGIAAMIWCFGTYQVLVPYYIAVQALLLLTYFMYSDVTAKDGFRMACCLVAIFLVGLIGYFIVSGAFIYYRYHGYTTALFNNYMGWGYHSVEECIANMKDDMMRVINSALPVFNREYLPVTALFLVLGIGNMIRLRRPVFVTLSAMVVLITSPYYMTLLLGAHQTLRAHLVYPVVFAATAGFVILWLANIDWFKMARLFKYPAAFFVILMIFHQVSLSNQIQQMVHTVAEADKNMAETIYAKTEQMRILEDGTMAPIVFIGKWAPELPPSYIKPWDATGISFFSIDSGYPQGSARISRLMRDIGLLAPEPTESQFRMAQEYSQSMAVWPNEGSYVLVDGVLIVKLSEP